MDEITAARYAAGQTLPVTILGHDVIGEVYSVLPLKCGSQMVSIYAIAPDGSELMMLTYNEIKS
jgi:hypothetical protein